MSTLADIPGLIRIDTTPLDVALEKVKSMTKPQYTHDEIYGRYCHVIDHFDAPAREVYDYISDTRSLEEWTMTLRGFTETDTAGLYVSKDLLVPDTLIYTRTESNPDAMTVDYHCAWDQGEHLWMIYLMRVADARIVLDKPGCVVQWTNCRHPFYADNPHAATAPQGRPWVGDFWGFFAAGHQIELNNLKTICEYRHANGLPIAPDWAKVAV